jgi:hypothetical protein
VSNTEEQVPPLSIEIIAFSAIDFKELLFLHTDLISISLVEIGSLGQQPQKTAPLS